MKHTELFVRRVDLSQNAQLRSDQEALGYRLGSCRAVQMHRVKGQEELEHLAD